DATLPLMGVKLMSLPEDPSVRFAGLLSDRERVQALEAATVVVCPSPYESLSLLALEALSVGTPVLVNARSAVLVEHCMRSNGGLYYAERDEFVECLKLLVRDARLRAALGQNGRDYVRRNYRWDVVTRDHLVQGRRLDVEELRGLLLHAPRRLERRLDQALLEIGDDILEGDAFGRHDKLRHGEARRLPNVLGDQLDANPRPRRQH